MIAAHLAVDALMGTVLQEAKRVLGGDLVGLYLDGSLALGDFDPATSDVDFLAAVARPLPETTVAALTAVHRTIRDSGRPLATELEGSYIPLPALRRHDPANAIFPNLERGAAEALRLKEHHRDWVIHRYVVREHGVTVDGPPPAALIDPVLPDDLRRAVAGVLRSWWATPDAARTIAHAHPGYLTYVVQTMCRALYTLETGLVASKPVACRWAREVMEETWRPLIDAARHREMDETMREETLALVRFMTG